MRDPISGGCHHPHVPQAVQIHRDVPIAYSLDNFVFWWKWTEQYLYQRVGYLLHLDFAGRELMGFELTPYHLAPEGVTRMNDGHAAWFFQQMAKAAKPLERIEDARAVWAAFLKEHGMQPALDSLKGWINRIATNT